MRTGIRCVLVVTVGARRLDTARTYDQRMSSQQKRSGHWDWWKGVAIVAVIAIHAVGTTATSDGPFAQEFAVAFRPFINFAVALFFCLAGYFAAKSWRGDAVSYWRSRGWRILPPYIAWTALAVLATKRSHLSSPSELVADFTLGLGIGIGYYVIVLLQYIALVPLLARLRGQRQNIAIMLLATAIGLAITYTIQTQFPDSRWARFPFSSITFIVWAPFFHLGFWASQNPDAIKARSDGLWLWLAGLAALAAVAEGFYWESQGLSIFAQSQIRVTSFMVSIFVALHVMASRGTVRTGKSAVALEWLGRISFMVYLSHMIFLPKITATIKSLAPDIFSIRPVAVVLATALTLAVCVAVAMFLRHLTRPVVHRDLLGAG